jgi:hypothetical protein
MGINMADFLTLVNRVLRRFNEVELTEANFATAKGFHAQVRDAVNDTVSFIVQQHPQWSFLLQSGQTTLTIGQAAGYPLPANTISTDFDSFFLDPDEEEEIDGVNLRLLTFDDWVRHYREIDQGGEETARRKPRFVFPGNGQTFGVSPVPDKTYSISYEYWSAPDRLVLPTDTTSIPEIWTYVIIDGASYYTTLFRGDNDAAAIHKGSFDKGIKFMAHALLKKDEYMTSTLIGRR